MKEVFQMSRIGNKVINVPAGVTVNVADNNNVTVKGPKGELNFKFNDELEISVSATEVAVKRPNDTKEMKALHGTTRALLNNMVKGVSEGFKKQLEINGVGYRAALQGNKLVLSAGYSHNVEMEVPAGLKVELPKNTTIIISGIDKQLVGQFAAEIREVRKPEPYKGKGIKYSYETIRRKEGKTAKKQQERSANMISKVSKNVTRQKRHLRIRQNVFGTAEKPRLNVFRSNKQIYAQIIDDETGKTLCSASSLDKEISVKNGSNVNAATEVGTLVAKRALALKIEAVVFDRGGYLYHGRVKALADAARAAGLKF